MREIDAVVVGAGFAGLFMLYRLREAGFSVQGIERGSDVGGTWFWNRYPGARCDVESLDYSYSFDHQLEQDWQWTERFATQPEILSYLQHVADRYELRPLIQFDTNVAAADWDEAAARWRVRTADGGEWLARYLILGTGSLSAAKAPDIEGLDDFAGQVVSTASWPTEGVDFAGKRAGVIGTGSSGIQVIPLVAEQADHLTVFQRTPSFTVPARNAPLSPDYLAQFKDRYRDHRRSVLQTVPGVHFRGSGRSALELEEDERRAALKDTWEHGGPSFAHTFNDIITDERANHVASEFVRGKIREIVKDPETADMLTPRDYPIGSKRIAVDTDYYATFNRDNVTLRDLRRTPLRRITPDGVELSDGVVPLDVLVLATGFDAMTGSFLRIAIRNGEGQTLKQKWAEGPRTYLGLMSAGFPNLFLIAGPGSPSVLTNMVLSIEQHVEWIRDCLIDLRARGLNRIEPERQAEDRWVDHVTGMAANTLFMAGDSWYLGANVPGKPRVFMPYIAGVAAYRAICEKVVAGGYAGFVRTGDRPPAGGPRARGGIGVALLCALLLGCGSPPTGIDAVDGAKLSALGDGRDWAAAGYNYDEQRFSPLRQINADNVGKLGLAWFADLPDARGQEATPIVIDGKLFVSGPWSKVFAFDAATGAALWQYDPGVSRAKVSEACCDAVNRGVAAWKGRLYVGTLDGRLVALDAKTGTPEWSVQTTDNTKPYTITGAPRVVKDLVLIGNSGAEFGVRGYVTAYDAATGAKKWRFYTVPNPTGAPDGEASDAVLRAKARPTWSDGGQWKQSGGGGTVWDAIVYDRELDQLYIGVGNGSPWNHGLRSEGRGDNLFVSSIVALNPETGKYLWHYQETPGETWDFTATQPIILATLPVGGKPRRVLMHAPKNGFFFVVDRKNGRLLSANKFVPVVNWASGYDPKSGRPIENPDARYYRTGKPFLAIPSAAGAHSWHPMSYNPTSGLVYIPAQEVGALYIPASGAAAELRPMGYNTGTDVAKAMYPRNAGGIRAATAGLKGALVAWDPVANRARWRVEYPTPWNGGTMTTAGNLVFQGTALGEFRAYAADTGRRLFAFPAGSGIMAGASTYLVGDTQYVAVLTGRGGALPLSIGYAIGAAGDVPNVPRLLVFKLGGTKSLPAAQPAAAAPFALPPPTGTQAQVATGLNLFGRYCQVCHGASAGGGGGVLPNLQRSGALADPQAWKAVVIDGALQDNGMVSFRRVMTPDEAESIRHYVIDEANWAKQNLSAP